MIVIQLSDPHIVAPGELLYGRVDTAEFLARSVAEINRLDPLPDVAVMTGDLVDHGNPAEYEHLRRLLAPLAMPIFVIPGNHDSREPLRAAFAGDGYLPADGFLQFAIEDYPVRLVALDTLIPGEGGGLLCSARLAWLDHVLASAPARPVLLMMHHPPFLTGIERMDRAGLQNSEAFAAVVARHPQIERILCGHLHRAIDRRFAGTVAGTAPSTAHQIRLNLVPGSRISFVFEPPGYQLHLWQESGLATYTAVLGDWPVPQDARPRNDAGQLSRVGYAVSGRCRADLSDFDRPR